MNQLPNPVVGHHQTSNLRRRKQLSIKANKDILNINKIAKMKKMILLNIRGKSQAVMQIGDYKIYQSVSFSKFKSPLKVGEL